MSTVTPSNDFVQIQPEVQSSRLLSQDEMTEFEVKSLEEQRKHLKYFSDKTNEDLNQQQEQHIFTNLSISQIFINLSNTIISIINELTNITKDTSLDDLVYIFIKDDRLIYLGILAIIIALGLYLLDITN